MTIGFEIDISNGFTPGGLLFLFLGGAIIVAFCAAILRAACWIYNMQVLGSSRTAPMPGWGLAILIVLISAIVQAAANGVIQLVWFSGQVNSVLMSLIAWPFTFIVGTVMVWVMLPTTFLRAVVIFLIQNLIALMVALFIFAMLGGFDSMPR